MKRVNQVGAHREERLQQAVFDHLKDIFHQDSLQETPVVQSLSLFFWESLSEWVRKIALLPEPFTIALSGPSGCGKSYIRETLVSQLKTVSSVSSFTQDNYYRDFEADFPHLPLELFYDQINFDDPAHIRFRHLARDLQRFQSMPVGSMMKLPRLRFGTPTQKPTIIEGALDLPVTPFMVTEGIHAFYDPAILPHYDFKIYVDVDEATRRKRWLERNIQENRGTTDNMWNTTVECLEQYILPTRPMADLVLNNSVPREQMIRFIEEMVRVIATPLSLRKRHIA